MRPYRLLLPIALLAGPAQARESARPVAPRPGYECTIGRQLEPGTSIVVRLEEDGRPIDANMEWRPPAGDYWQPRVSVLWLLRGSTALRTGDGAVFLSWNRLEDARRRGRPARLRMELTTEVRPGRWPWPFLTGTEQQGGYNLHGNLADFAAFARGAPALFVVLRDRDAQAVAQASLDRTLFAQAVAETDAALAALRPMLADYRNRCTHSDDIDPQVVVT